MHGEILKNTPFGSDFISDEPIILKFKAPNLFSLEEFTNKVRHHEAVHKKILFPVQRVAKIEASRAAAIFFILHFFFFPMKILSIFGKFFFFLQK